MVLMRAAELLRNLAAAWAQATEEQKHDLARLVFRVGRDRGDRVIAVTPQPDFAPFFNLAEDNETGRPEMTDPDRQDVLTGGSDGDRSREIDAVAPPLVPFLHPDLALRVGQRRGVGRYAPQTKSTRIPRDRWPEVVARAQRESLPQDRPRVWRVA